MSESAGARNPLFFPLIGVGISAAQSVREFVVSRQLDLFGTWSIVAAASLLVLYLRRSLAAGTFMFWSLVPTYPVYFSMTWLGWYGSPARPSIYAVLAVIWVIGSILAWRWKGSYEEFIRLTEQPAAISG